MGLDELLGKIRTYYVDRLVEVSGEAIESGGQIVLEPAYLDADGVIVKEGYFDSGVRVDYVLLENGEVKDSVNVDTEGMLSFEPISFDWDGLDVSLGPFQWNYCDLYFPTGSDLTYLRAWFEKWFEGTEGSNAELQQCVHFLSDPEKSDAGIVLYVDFGSANTSCLMNLFDETKLNGIGNLRLGANGA